MTLLRQIAAASTAPSTTDFVVGVTNSNTTDSRISINQLAVALQPFLNAVPGIINGSIIVPVRSSNAATVTVSATTDYFLALDPTPNAITVNLPANPLTGLTFLIKDATGLAATHNITVVPAAGTIDGGSSFAIANAFSSIAVTYTGTQWSIN